MKKNDRSANVRIQDAFVKDTDDISISKETKKELFAKQLRNRLDELQWANKKLAERLNKKSPEISKWLSGNHNFTLDTIFDIEDQLGIRLVEIGNIPKGVKGGVRGFKVFSTQNKFNRGVLLNKASNQSINLTSNVRAKRVDNPLVSAK